MTNEHLILLVEDNPDDEELTLRALRRGGLINRVVVARDGAEAVDLLLGPGERLWPDVILLDLNLPKLSGLEVLRQIRQDADTRRLPVVVLTSSREEPDVVASYELGANSFVQKPVDFLAFAEAASQLGIYWLLLNQRPQRPQPVTP